MDGLTGDHVFEFAWRWAATGEERLLAGGGRLATPFPAPRTVRASGVWPGFRGPGRDGVVGGVWIATDWSESPPIEPWRRPVGPGWSSFAVARDRLYTQEQRGEEEVVACYDATTGEPVWVHSDRARFFESMGGVGPRATPTLSNGRVYSLGATGILNALDAGDGSLAWTPARWRPSGCRPLPSTRRRGSSERPPPTACNRCRR